MRIAGKKRIKDFMKSHASSCTSLKAWADFVEAAHWHSPSEIKQDFASASFLSKNRVVFNIGGNNFRLVVVAVYVQETIVVSWIGTHAEYDKLKL